MKKILITILSLIFIVSMTSIGIGCKEEVVEEAAETVEAAGETEEAAPAEEVEEEKEDVLIGVITYRSGVAIDLGEHSVKAVQLAVKQINDSGGVLDGRKVVIKEYDEGYSPDISVASAKEAIADGCVGVVGLQDATTAIPALLAFKEANIPILIPTVGTQKVADEGFYGSFHVWGAAPPHPDGKIPGIARYLEDEGWKRIIMVCVESEWSHRVHEELAKVYGEADSTVEYLEPLFFPYGETEAEAEITKAVNENPDFIWCEIWGHDVVISSFNRMAELGYEGDRSITVESLVASDVEELGDVAEGIYCPERWRFDPNNPAGVEYRDAFFELHGEEPEPFGEPTYEAAMMLLLGIRAANSTETEKITDAIYALDWMTPRGQKLAISDVGDVIVQEYMMSQVVDGKIIVVDRIPVVE